MLRFTRVFGIIAMLISAFVLLVALYIQSELERSSENVLTSYGLYVAAVILIVLGHSIYSTSKVRSIPQDADLYPSGAADVVYLSNGISVTFTGDTVVSRIYKYNRELPARRMLNRMIAGQVLVTVVFVLTAPSTHLAEVLVLAFLLLMAELAMMGIIHLAQSRDRGYSIKSKSEEEIKKFQTKMERQGNGVRIHSEIFSPSSRVPTMMGIDLQPEAFTSMRVLHVKRYLDEVSDRIGAVRGMLYKLVYTIIPRHLLFLTIPPQSYTFLECSESQLDFSKDPYLLLSMTSDREELDGLHEKLMRWYQA